MSLNLPEKIAQPTCDQVAYIELEISSITPAKYTQLMRQSLSLNSEQAVLSISTKNLTLKNEKVSLVIRAKDEEIEQTEDLVVNLEFLTDELP